MMKYKYYFCEDFDERCYGLHHFEDMIASGEYDEFRLKGARLEINGDGFYCQYHCEVFERGCSDCGILCSGYKPRNGKSGICVSYRNCYEITNDTFLLTKNGLVNT